MSRRSKPRRRPAARRRSGRVWLLAAAAGVAVLAIGLGRLWVDAPRANPPPAAAPVPARPAPAAGDRPPAPPRAAERTSPGGPAPPSGPGRIAIVIDDLGRSVATVERLARLNVPITYAVLPFESRTDQVVAAQHARRLEYLCHLPMQGAEAADPGRGALLPGMSDEELRLATRAALAAVPGAAGVNNHMGSVLSSDRRAMTAVLSELQSRDLYFLDSRTSADSVGFAVARDLGVPAVERQVFLDRERGAAAVEAQWQRALKEAQGRGAAVVIGHPYPETLALLERAVGLAQAAGFELVAVSALVPAGGLSQ